VIVCLGRDRSFDNRDVFVGCICGMYLRNIILFEDLGLTRLLLSTREAMAILGELTVPPNFMQ
jgi:hypothetical protein